MKKHIARLLLMLLIVTFVFTALPQTVGAADNVTYKVTTKICNGFQNGTNSQKVNFTFYGTNGSHKLNNTEKMIKGDAYERDRTDTFEFSCADLGQIYALNASCGTDGVKFEYIKIEKSNGSGWTQMASFSIGEWIDNTNKTYYANRNIIYRVKVVTADNPLDSTNDSVELLLKDKSGQSASLGTVSNLHSSSEVSFDIKTSQSLGDLDSVILKKTTKGSTSDDWRPMYIQVEKMSGSTTAGDIKWDSEVLFVGNQVVSTSQVSLNRYTGSVKTDKATGLASIFFEPNFYVISSIVLVLGGAGVAVYLKNKKNTVRREKVK
jgi:hypothetical protein